LDYSIVRLPSSLLLGQGGAAGGDPFSSYMFPLMLGVTVLMFYLLMMRPEQKKRKEMEQLIANVKKNDHVETIGGICGTVVNAVAGSRFVTIRVDDTTGTKLRVRRTAISSIGDIAETEQETKSGD
jgi:preprotein translocase subunit YajC